MDLINISVLFLIVATSFTYSAKLPLRVRDNRLLSNSLNPTPEHVLKPREWIKITEAPPKVINREFGTHIELECEAIGSPSPRIQWVKDDTPITDDYDYSNNIITNTAIAKIKSRLIINSALPIHSGIISCYAESGIKTAIASTNLYVKSQGNQNFSDFLSAELIPTAREPVRIVLFNTFVMENIGSNVIVPCKAVGKPKAEVFWFNNNEQLITNQNSRIKILPDGELSIDNLHWSDMGSYTCLARNAFSEDSISTFVYPMLNEN